VKVKLTRRWGPHRASEKLVEVSESQGRWLVQHNYAESTSDVQAPVQQAAAEGTHGADPLAGGDATRLRPRVPRSTGSTAAQAAGSSPAYRAGFDAEASGRQGEAGRAYVAPTSGDEGGDNEKKPARRRSSRSSS
jgi:hypothetical protein